MAVEDFRRVYDDGNTASFGLSIQRFQNIESVYIFHPQIEYDQVRLALARHTQALASTAGLHNVATPIRQEAPDEIAGGLIVVDDENMGLRLRASNSLQLIQEPCSIHGFGMEASRA